MRVRVVKCSNPYLWYANKLGEEFKVLRKQMDIFRVEYNGEDPTIFESDCEIIKSEAGIPTEEVIEEPNAGISAVEKVKVLEDKLKLIESGIKDLQEENKQLKAKIEDIKKIRELIGSDYDEMPLYMAIINITQKAKEFEKIRSYLCEYKIDGITSQSLGNVKDSIKLIIKENHQKPYDLLAENNLKLKEENAMIFGMMAKLIKEILK